MESAIGGRNPWTAFIQSNPPPAGRRNATFPGLLRPYLFAKWHTTSLHTTGWVCQLGKKADLDSLGRYAVPNVMIVRGGIEFLGHAIHGFRSASRVATSLRSSRAWVIGRPSSQGSRPGL